MADYLRPYASRLIGVDLSVTMLSKARRKGQYDELHEEELTKFFRANPRRFDLITSVDTLCYIGAMEETATTAATSLIDGGWMCFTVEKAPPEFEATLGYGLADSGRYYHEAEYIQRALSRAEFREIDIRDVVLRKEMGEDVLGLLVLAQH